MFRKYWQKLFAKGDTEKQNAVHGPVGAAGQDRREELRRKAGVGISSAQDIHVRAEQMPRLKLWGKPSHTEYLSIKMHYRDKAVDCLMDYVDFVSQLDGLEGRSDMRDMVIAVLRNFVVRYWDMPASRNNHHDYPWGHCLHSLEVACAEAQKAVSWTPMTAHGHDDITRSRMKGFVVLGSFVRGLMHDAHKFYQYTPSGTGKNLTTFSPFLNGGGNMLDFKISCPINPDDDWLPLQVDAGKLNLIEFYLVIPPELGTGIPYIEMVRNLQFLLGMESLESDRESAARDLSRRRGGNPNEALNQAIQAYFQHDPGRARLISTVFRLNDIWTAVDASLFFTRITSPNGFVDSASLKRYLLHTGTLQDDGSGDALIIKPRFLHRVEGKSDTVVSNKTLAFIRTPFLETNAGDAFAKLGSAVFHEDEKSDLGLILSEITDCFAENWPEPAKADGSVKTGKEGKNKASDPPQTDGQTMPEATPVIGDATPPEQAHLAEAPIAEVSISVAPPDAVPWQPSAYCLEDAGFHKVDWPERFCRLLFKSTDEDFNFETGWLVQENNELYAHVERLVHKLIPISEGVDMLETKEQIYTALYDASFIDFKVSKIVRTHVKAGEPDILEGNFWRIAKQRTEQTESNS